MGHGKENDMSTLEKTINLLNALPENQIETIYSFVQFLSSQQTKEMPGGEKPLDDILKNIVGVIPDTGKTLEEYREERMRERYEAIN
jgi:hypothetical protein